MIRVNHALFSFAFPSVRAARSSSAWDRRIETGSFRGEPANVEEMVSRQNCMRRAPTVGLETMSATWESEMLKARRARYAGRTAGGMKAVRTSEGLSYLRRRVVQ